MTDVNYTLRSTVHRANVATVAQGEAGNVKKIACSKSVTARSANDTMKAIRMPSNARIHGDSLISWDDLASSGSPTLDVGIGPVDSNMTADADALRNGLDITSAGTAKLVADHADYGKMLWELAGLSEDPSGELDIYFSFVDAATNVTGDVTLEVEYTLD